MLRIALLLILAVGCAKPHPVSEADATERLELRTRTRHLQGYVYRGCRDFALTDRPRAIRDCEFSARRAFNTFRRELWSNPWATVRLAELGCGFPRLLGSARGTAIAADAVNNCYHKVFSPKGKIDVK